MRIGYMRISTDLDRQAFDLQHDALIAAGVDPRNIHCDKASGAKVNRPGLQTALDYMQTGDCLVVWKLDRLGRSLTDLLDLVMVLKQKGISFHSITENIDTTSIQGELILQIFGAIAQFERGLIQERIKAGLESARKRGRVGGRPRAIDDEKLQQIMVAIASGVSKSAACRMFGVKRSTLYSALDSHAPH